MVNGRRMGAVNKHIHCQGKCRAIDGAADGLTDYSSRIHDPSLRHIDNLAPNNIIAATRSGRSNLGQDFEWFFTGVL
jgi:hypothetical protein